jgi:Glycosyl hydrolases family 2, TIM barrel domain
MKIDRRNLISLIIGFAFAITSPILLSLSQRKYLTPTRKRSFPFFLGWYDNYIENLNVSERVSTRGIDLLMPYVGDAEKEKIKVALNTAKKARIKILLQIYSPLVESGNISAVKDFIRAYKNHPSVYGWYLYDEPELKKPNPLSPDLLTEIYQAIKEEDKSKPVAIVFGDVNKIESYSQAMDILMWDNYPCEDGVSEFQWASSYQKALNRVSSIADIKNKKFWNVLQAYSGHGFKKRLPTKAEFRYMFYASILAGADGLLFWMYAWSTPSWNESVLYPTIKEFRYYIPAIMRGEDLNNPVQVNHSNIEVKLFSIPNTKKKLIIAVNHNQTQMNFTAKLSHNLAGKTVVMNNKTITHLSTQGSFNVILNSYEVRLYQIG